MDGGGRLESGWCCAVGGLRRGSNSRLIVLQTASMNLTCLWDHTIAPIHDRDLRDLDIYVGREIRLDIGSRTPV